MSAKNTPIAVSCQQSARSQHCLDVTLANNQIALTKYCVGGISKNNPSNVFETSIPHLAACLEIYSINGEGGCIQGCIIPI